MRFETLKNFTAYLGDHEELIDQHIAKSQPREDPPYLQTHIGLFRPKFTRKVGGKQNRGDKYGCLIKDLHVLRSSFIHR